MDRNGFMAEKGIVLREYIHAMIRHPYFKQKPPKSTGRETFNENFLPVSLRRLIIRRPNDVLNTLTYFTAYSILESYKKFAPAMRLKEIVVSGGGAHNRTLMSHIQHLAAPISVTSIEKLGIPAQAKEPLAFAFFALRAIQGKSNHLPSATGAVRKVPLGKITPGLEFRGLR